MRSRGCSARPSLFRRDGDRSCPAFRVTLRKMKSNLKRLQRSAKRESGGVSKSQRRKIRAAMRRKGCEFKGRRTIAEQIFGKRDRAARNSDDKWSKKQAVNLTSRKGTMRTMCVRTCDGYYFPVSFSTRKSSLEKDADACANMCPGTNTELFVQPIGNSEPDAMVSTVDGSPYKDLPRAFAFKKRFDRSCVCNYRTVRRETADLPLMSKRPTGIKSNQRAQQKRTIRYPSWRDGTPAYPAPTLQEPPKTANNGQSVEVAQDDTIISADENSLSNRRVRIIGDAFLPSR